LTKISRARISEFPKGILDPMPVVSVTLEDGEEKELFSYYPDEINFTEQEFVGLTVAQAMELRHKKDVSYLQS